MDWAPVLHPPFARRLWQTAVLVCSAIFLTHVFLILTLRGDPDMLGPRGSLMLVVASAFATSAAIAAAWRSMDDKGGWHRTWALLALALSFNALGDLLWWLLGSYAHPVAPDLWDPFYLISYPLFTAGLLAHPAGPWRRGERAKLLLETGSVLLGGSLLFWVFGISPLVALQQTDVFMGSLALAYPLGAAALFWALVLLLLRRVHITDRVTLNLLAVGAVLRLVADGAFSYIRLGGTRVGPYELDVLYSSAALIFSLAAIRHIVTRNERKFAASAAAPAAVAPTGLDQVNAFTVWGVWLPYLGLMLTLMLLVWAHYHPVGMDFSILAAVLAIVGALLTGRQMLAFRENRLLHQAQLEMTEGLRQARDELEMRVAERTCDLEELNEALALRITQHEETEAQLRRSLAEKEVLLKEVYHRVKNNLQVVSSLLNLQSRGTNDSRVVDVLTESQRRVRSMALIHQKLYASPDLARIDFGDYLHSLADYLFMSCNADRRRIGLHLDVSKTWLDLDTAVPCGLIVNELISNALKHAFPGDRQGLITLRLAPASDGWLRLSVIDDGVGLPGSIDVARAGSLGLQLTGALVQQLGGDMAVESESGTAFYITFPTC